MTFSTFAKFALLLCLCGLPALAQSVAADAERERILLERIEALEERLARLEQKLAGTGADPGPGAAGTRQTVPAAAATEIAPAALAKDASGPAPAPAAPEPSWLGDTTVNFYFDGYYAWNTNRPLGRINLLRAYDVSANSFSINQAGVVIDRAPNPDSGSRWGYRLDLMHGQATETLQGGAQNENRPQTYRHLFQAYGTYVAPVGKGLSIDFGKWAGSLGAEGNYTKDQINYSRSYFFNFLPFYHTGLRATLPVNDKVSLTYWLVNGANQAEDFNEFKSQLGRVVITPTKNLSWALQYYAGREQRDLVPALHPGAPALPTQPGLSTSPILPAPRGRFHAVDTYAFWNASERITLGGELAYALNRVDADGPPQRVTGGAAYLRYQLNPRVYFGQRYARLNDTAGLFSGQRQNLNDVTTTLGYRPSEGFEARVEFRRDFSNVPFFLRRPEQMSAPPARAQNTFSLGLLWWFGGKQESW